MQPLEISTLLHLLKVELFVPLSSKKYTANVKLDSAHRYVEIDMIFETARFELVGGIICEPR